MKRYFNLNQFTKWPLVVATALCLVSSSLGSGPALAVDDPIPSRIIVHPIHTAVSLYDSSSPSELVTVRVIDTLGRPIDASSDLFDLSTSNGCGFPEGQAPSRRTCIITAAYGAVVGSAKVEVFDFSAMSGSLQGQSTVGSTLKAPATPPGWPALSYQWYHSGQPNKTLGRGQAYRVGFTDIGSSMRVRVRENYAGLADRYYGADRDLGANSVPKADPVLTVRLNANPINTATRPVVRISAVVPGFGPVPGRAPVYVDYDGSIINTTLVNGVGAVTLPKLAAGNHTVLVTFGGTNQTEAKASGRISLTVKKAVKTKLQAKLAKKTIKRKARAKVSVVVSARGKPTPRGKVTVTWGKGKGKSISQSLKGKGKATIKLPKLKKGTYKLTVSYSGQGALTSSSARLTLRVK